VPALSHAFEPIAVGKLHTRCVTTSLRNNLSVLQPLCRHAAAFDVLFVSENVSFDSVTAILDQIVAGSASDCQ
jgi:hypothetical protein